MHAPIDGPQTRGQAPRLDIQYRPLGGPVKDSQAGQRVDAYLSKLFPFFSRAAWQKKIQTGHVLVDGGCVKTSYRLLSGQSLAIYHPQVAEPEVDRGLYPIWKRGAVMAVYKPANLPMHENGPYRKNTFAYLVGELLGSEWAAVHRLDRETSGIVLCGAPREIRQELSRSLAKRVLDKEYLAIARGHCQRDFWVEQGPIADLESSEIRIKKWVLPGGLPSETHFKRLEQRGRHTLLKAFPKTGRTNQIRIHAAYNGLPLVGDMLYHEDEAVFLEWFARGKTANVTRQVEFHRLLLHAHALTFIHPEDGQAYRVVCPMPEEMQGFWDALGKN